MRKIDQVLDQLFREARSFNAWLDKPVTDAQIREIYHLLKWGPTNFNSSPARFVFLRTRESKERLKPTLTTSNVEQVMTAPVTAIVAYDLRFYEKMPRLFPHKPASAKLFEKNPQLVEVTALRNSTLQGAWLIMAARALGLDAGPLSGFDNAKVDEIFFPEGQVKSNFLCNIGYGDRSKLSPRLPRLRFEEACLLL